VEVLKRASVEIRKRGNVKDRDAETWKLLSVKARKRG
jgi:hypothetical protein